MLGSAILSLFVTSAWAQGTSGAKGAPLSPFVLAQEIDSAKSAIDWSQVWRRLGRTDQPPDLPHCGDPDYSPCSTELIYVPDPLQVILLIQAELPDVVDFYLRFRKQEDNWTLAGHQMAHLKYYPRRHEMARFSSRPFLKVAVQGESGTGLASEIEEWFDLTLPSFEPVFSFPVQGHDHIISAEINREVHGSASQEQGNDPEAIRLSLLVRFSFNGKSLGDMSFSGIYEWFPETATFKLRKAYAHRDIRSPAVMPPQEFEDMLHMEDGPSTEALLPYVLPGLKEIASGGDVETKKDLKALLESCQTTPEQQELLKLLGSQR